MELELANIHKSWYNPIVTALTCGTFSVDSSGNITTSGTISTASEFKANQLSLNAGICTINPSGNITTEGTISTDGAQISSNGSGTLTTSHLVSNDITLGLTNPITIQSAVVTLTAAQVLAMTTSPSTWLQVIGPTPGKFCSVIRCSITGSTTAFTGTPTAQFYWYFWNGSNTQEAYSVAITQNVFATSAIAVPIISTGNQGYSSWIYGSTFGIGFTSGSNWTGGGSDVTVTVLYYMST